MTTAILDTNVLVQAVIISLNLPPVPALKACRDLGISHLEARPPRQSQNRSKQKMRQRALVPISPASRRIRRPS